MRKLHAKVGTILTVLLCVVLVLGVLGVAGAAETSYVLKSNRSGYVANSRAITLGSDTVVVMNFGVDFIFEDNGQKTGLGEGEVGFGIVDARYVNSELVNDSNAEHGFAVAYGDTTKLIGGKTGEVQPQNESADTSKDKVFAEGKSYRVIFDNSIGEMFVESEATGTGTWYLVQHVTGIKKFEEGTNVYLGYFYRGGANMVLADVDYKSYVSTVETTSLELTMTEHISYEPGTKVTTLSSSGNSYISNKTPTNNTDKNDYVMSFNISDFMASDDVNVAFAITTDSPADGKIKSSENGMRFKLTSKSGVLYDINGEEGVGDAFINVTSVFTAGNKVKAVFSPNTGAFTLLIDTTGVFIEQFKMEGLDIPTEGVTFGMEISGDVNATLYGLELFHPSDPNIYGLNPSTFISEGDPVQNPYGSYGIKIEEDSDGVTLSTQPHTACNAAGGKDTCAHTVTGTIYTDNELTVNKGQMLAILVEDLIAYTPTYKQANCNSLQKFSFAFIKKMGTTASLQQQSAFPCINEYFAIDYEITAQGDKRYTHDINTKPDPSKNAISQEYRAVDSFGDGFSFVDIIAEKKYGVSYMACYDPYDLMYYLYQKTNGAPDYTLVSTLNINTCDLADNVHRDEILEDMKADSDDNTFNLAIRMTGSMTVKFGNMKALVVNKEDVGANTVLEYSNSTDNEGSADLVTKGNNVYAKEDGYIYTKDPIVIPDGGLAIEYDIENVNFLAGTYNIGWIITNSEDIITSGMELARQTDAKQTVVNSDIADEKMYSLLHFVGSNDLTPSFSDTMRDALDNAGTSFRVVFYKDGKLKLQSKQISAYEWNDIDYAIEESGTEQSPKTQIRKYEDKPVYVGIRLQGTYNLDITDDIRIYELYDETQYNGSVSVKGGSMNVVPGTLRFADIRVQSIDDTRGCVKITSNENIDESNGDVLSGSVYTNSSVKLVATAEPGYAFEGWYANGTKVSVDSTMTVTIVNDCEYQANFVKATKVTVTNGMKSYKKVTNGYYKNDDYMRIMPIGSVGYKFVGWNIRLVEIDLASGETITKESYELALKKDTSESNMLLPTYDNGNKTTNVWGSLSNTIVSGDVCTLTKDLFFNTINFGSFSVKDRAGFENGDLLIMIPGLECDYEFNPTTGEDEMTVERKVLVDALYETSDSVTVSRGEASYSEQHIKDVETTTMVGVCFIALFFIGMITLIALKKYVTYKKDIKALLEYEFVLKENDKL